MVPIQTLAVLAFILHAAPGISPGDPVRPRLLVTVRTDGQAAAARQLLVEASATARDIWRPYVDVTFGRAGDVQRTIEVDQLDLVVTDRLQKEVGSLGWIEFINDEPSRTMTVSTAAIERLMAASSWSGRPMTLLPPAVRRQFLVRALGRSIAHEMGHYLLRSKVHARRGLMRDELTADEIMAPDNGRDRLEAEDRRRLDRRLLEYAAARSGDRPPA